MTSGPSLGDLELQRVERLAQLELDDTAREELLHDLRRVLDFAARMEDLADEGDGDAAAGDEAPTLRWRADEVRRFEDPRGTDHTPHRHGSWFVIPDTDART